MLQTLWEGPSDPGSDASEVIAMYKHNLTASCYGVFVHLWVCGEGAC